MLELQLLGQFNLRLNGHPIDLPSRPAQSLLAYLALRPGTPYRRERLAGLLWPEATEANARSYLRQALWRIRKALEAAPRDYFAADDLTIAFTADGDCRLDVALLEKTDPAAAPLDELLHAIEVYHGELLPGFYDEWVAAERERLQAIYEHKLALLLERLATEERWPAVIEWAERWIALGSVPEPAYRALMRAHHATGDRASMAAAYQRCAEALRRELDVEPAAETRALLEQLSRTEPLAAIGRPPLEIKTNLPRQLTTFIGREREIAAIKQLLHASTSRLITLTGSGGCGKTRLSLQVGQDVLADYAQGVWLIELAPVSDPALVTQTVATALGLREEAGRPIAATLVDYLRGRKALLLLDNCEHLVADCAQLAETLLHACPDLTILATSREQLGIAGETAFRVPSLAAPDPRLAPPIETLEHYEAVQLFSDRARLALPEFAVTADNAGAIAQICHRLDGIPLAIELAAARANVLSVDQIAARLTNVFRLLTGGSRTALPRQQTLRALMDWSYNLLTAAERTLLRRLAVFAGGWTLDAAEAIGADDDPTGLIQPDDVLDVLTQLVNKSLVIAEGVDNGQARYRLLATIRQYALEKMSDYCDTDCVWDRHLDYFVRLAERAEPELRGPQQAQWLKRLQMDVDNLHAALDWSMDGAVEAGLRLATALYEFVSRYGPINALADKLRQILQQPAAQPRSALRAKALDVAANLVSWQGELAEARTLAECALSIYRELGEASGEAHSLDTLGVILCLMDDYQNGPPLIFESLRIYRALNEATGIAQVLLDLGSMADARGGAQTPAYLQESLAIFRQRGDAIGAGYALNELGRAALWQGDFEQAERWLAESRQAQLAIGSLEPMLMQYLGVLALRRGRYAEARAYLEQGASVCQENGSMVLSGWFMAGLGYVDLREGHEERARATFIDVQQRFREMGSKIGVVYALEGLASLAVRRREFDRAARLYAWTNGMRTKIGDQRPPVEQAEVDRDYAVVQAQLTAQALQAATLAGRDMTMDEAVALASESRTM